MGADNTFGETNFNPDKKKKTTYKTGEVTFTKLKKGDPDKYAKIVRWNEGGQYSYRVTNLNMPYMGTTTETWSQREFERKSADGLITIEWDK